MITFLISTNYFLKATKFTKNMPVRKDLIDNITDLSSEVPLDFLSSRVQVLSGHKYTLKIKVVRSPTATSLYSLDTGKKSNHGEVLNRDDFKHISDLDVVTRDQKR